MYGNDGMVFAQFFSNIEKTPFSDNEVCRILDMSNTRFDSATELGLIQRSVRIHYRFDLSFSFMNIFDIFEYALRRDFFFLNFGCQPEVSELIFSIVDEFSSIIDNCIDTTSCRKIGCFKKDIINSCMDNSTKWNEYWLYDGEPFSARKCSTVALRTWDEVFERTISLITPPISIAEQKRAI